MESCSKLAGDDISFAREHALTHFAGKNPHVTGG